MSSTPHAIRTVSLLTLGCARNDVDSEELAGRLAADGWSLVDDPAEADVAVVNTCGFIESAKQDSINALVEAHALKGNGRTQAIVAVGCLAERYGVELANELSEVDAVLSMDDYRDISQRLQTILAGGSIEAHRPKDRRSLLPIAPNERASARPSLEVNSNVSSDHLQDSTGSGSLGQGSRFFRRRLDSSPVAPLKIASGCDRRCTFCAIPQFRGAFLSRRPHEIIDEARWLAENGVSELFLVSENTTSYGKDLGDLRLLEKLLPELAAIDGVERIRLSYLQPAEMRPSLLQAIVATEKVVPYFDLSFQHASGTVLRRMRRFGDCGRFLHLLEQIRALHPEAGIRSNFIVGFPGESEQEYQELVEFMVSSRLDAMGVFGYSDEDGTEALDLEGKLDEDEIRTRVSEMARLVDELVSQRAEERIGQAVRVVIEDEHEQEGRAEHQGPEVDGTTRIKSRNSYRVGEYVDAIVIESDGADLVAQPL